MTRSNGRLEPEVIVNYGDGFAYSKYKLEEAFRTGGLLDKPTGGLLGKPTGGLLDKPVTTKPLAAGRGDPPLKKGDIDVIIHEFEIPRIQAEKVLVENGGDLEKALRALVALPSPAPTS